MAAGDTILTSTPTTGRPIPTELLERRGLDVDRAAAALGVPADELQAARHEHATIPAQR